MSRGMWLSSFQAGVAADKPTVYPGDADIALYYATDTSVLYIAAQPSSGTTATWATIGDAAAIKAVTDLPTAEPTAGGVWNDGGTLKAALT